MMIRKLLFTTALLITGSTFAQKFTDSLLLHVPINSNATDNGPFQYPATTAGLTYGNDARGIANQSIVCNGTANKITYSTAGTKFQHSLPLSVAVNVNINSQTGNFPIFYTADNYTKYAGIWVQVIDGYVYANVGDGASNGTGNRYTVRSTNKLTISTWYHICVIFRSSNVIELYINGSKDESTTASGTNATMGWNTSANASYGYASKGAGTFNFFDGKLDNLMYWGRALSAAEVKMSKDLIYYGELGNAIQDFGPTSTIPTKSGTSSWFDRLGNPGAGVKFNGASDKVSFVANSNYKPTLPFTMSAWVFSTGKAGIMPMMATTDHVANAYYGSTLWLENGYPTMYIGDGSCNGATCRVTYMSSDSVKVGQWNMVTAVVTSLSNIKMYINGQPVSGGALSGTGTVMNNSVSIAGNIGFLTDAYSISNKYFKGTIDEVFVMNNTLLAADILTLYGKSVYVSQHPSSVLADISTSNSIICNGEGTEKVNYQWQKMQWGTGWNNLGSETKSVLSFPSLSAADTGYYRCVVSITGKSANSNAVRVDMKAVTNSVSSKANKIVIYPNPANTSIGVIMGNSLIHKIKIIDINGKTVLEKTIGLKSVVLDISSISNGNYIVQIETQDAVLQENLQIQR